MSVFNESNEQFAIAHCHYRIPILIILNCSSLSYLRRYHEENRLNQNNEPQEGYGCVSDVKYFVLPSLRNRSPYLINTALHNLDNYHEHAMVDKY